MAPDLASVPRSGSPDSSGRDSPIPKQWRAQLSGREERLLKDKAFRRYAAAVDKALALFETALEEWADYISFLNRLLKALQSRPSDITVIPTRATVAKRLSQCLNPSLPSGVHQKALEIYSYVFETIGTDGLSRDLPLYLPGLASVLSFASLSVRSPYLDLLEKYFLKLDPRALRPGMKSIILALIPGLEDESAEDFDRTLRLVTSFKETIRTSDSELLTEEHATGDDYFWQCFFLASITSPGRRPGALAYLVRCLPPQAAAAPAGGGKAAANQPSERVSAVVTSPEPGLLIRCFASGLSDEQLLNQRGFLDLLVTHLPLSSDVLQSRVKPEDLQLLMKAAVGVVIRRDMSLNRRLWAWFLGPEPAAGDQDAGSESPRESADQQSSYVTARTSYFEEYGLQPLTAALLSMIKASDNKNAAERARPYRICLSLMDRWEIGGLVIPEVFLPVVENVRSFRRQASSKAEFAEVLRSASVFFDGIESGLIYGELVAQLAQAIGPGNLSIEERKDKLSLVQFVLANFNVREEEMVTTHAPLSCLAALSMLEDLGARRATQPMPEPWVSAISRPAFEVAISFLELVPPRAFPNAPSTPSQKRRSQRADLISNKDILKKIQDFYVNDQGSMDTTDAPFQPLEMGEVILQKAVQFIHTDTLQGDLSARILILALVKMPTTYRLDVEKLMGFVRGRLDVSSSLPFPEFSSIVQLATELHATQRIQSTELSDLATLLVRNAWSYLSAPEPKYHVETVRCLWQLQTSLTLSSRDIEATLSSLLVEGPECSDGLCSIDSVHTFGILWSLTLQDNPSDRRGSRATTLENRAASRLAGMDHFEVMLTRPLFLVLDALVDERTRQYMTVKSWLINMVGIDRLFLVFVHKLSELGFLADLKEGQNDGHQAPKPVTLTEDDDLDICLYYLRGLSNVLRIGGDMAWNILASKHVSFAGRIIQISSGGEEDELTLQDFFIRACVRCITGDPATSADIELGKRVFALVILHQFFLNQPVPDHMPISNLETVLLGRLWKSIGHTDAHVQVLLLDVVYDVLKIRDTTVADAPSEVPAEKRNHSMDPARTSRVSLSMSDPRPMFTPPPQELLKCLLAALSSPNSRPVLDSWVAFLTDCLPFYADAIFQVLIPLVETLCRQIGATFINLRNTFQARPQDATVDSASPEATLIHLLNGLEHVLARAHDQLLAEEARAQLIKAPDHPQSLFGSMVSGVFQTDGQQARSATANDRLTVHLAFQDATRMCYRIWSWGLGDEARQQDDESLASFHYTSLRMRNRARRLLEHLFTAENLECLETAIDIWRNTETPRAKAEVFKLLGALEASRPRHSIPALFNSIYSRTNPGALEPSRKSTMTISLEDYNLVVFLVEYTRSLDDDAMDEIWQDCIVFLKDLLSNPFPHRQNLHSLLEFAAILGEKVDNTNFGEQKRMRRELGDLFLRLLAALFTTRPITLEAAGANGTPGTGERQEDVVAILASIVPNLHKVLVEPDRVLSAASTISTNVIGPTIRSKNFPETVSQSTMALLHELSRLPNNQKTWKKDIGEAFNDQRFFGMGLGLVKDGWVPLLRQWARADKEKMGELVSRINAPTTAGIVFGVGATSARLEADRKTQVNLRRIASLVVSSPEDAFVTDLGTIFQKLVELLGATPTSSPSSATRADVYMVLRALVLKTSPIQLALIWPEVNAELQEVLSSVVPTTTRTTTTSSSSSASASDSAYNNASVLQACKLLDVLVCVAPDDFQLHEWLFVTDTIDAVYRYSSAQPVALVDELSEELGNTTTISSSAAQWLTSSTSLPTSIPTAAKSASAAAAAVVDDDDGLRRPLLGPGGTISADDVSLERKDELLTKVLRPFFGQLSISAFESTYSMGTVDREACLDGLLKDLFDERSIARAP
ncbi:hypothetical protein GMORB2_6149 [Geosmithia morbida]|uniref:Dopey N-terminal domain-containing protein n=1 Tax=Geosmithia morbida TaxID=1094350 RepID=A0A9P4YXE7_9HYPO|nr:uncharacterized protein GMORB2_6149 [Geosmithia morbida]KAF4123448.1 hypothetical protein GMORB2_6149 [Geosmithia morbida]